MATRADRSLSGADRSSNGTDSAAIHASGSANSSGGSGDRARAAELKDHCRSARRSSAPSGYSVPLRVKATVTVIRPAAVLFRCFGAASFHLKSMNSIACSSHVIGATPGWLSIDCGSPETLLNGSPFRAALTRDALKDSASLALWNVSPKRSPETVQRTR
jgi:hypothetical protein